MDTLIKLRCRLRVKISRFTAARLEANAHGGTILISRVVADILGSRADVTSLGNSIKLKGKSADFEILRLNSIKDLEVD